MPQPKLCLVQPSLLPAASNGFSHATPLPKNPHCQVKSRVLSDGEHSFSLQGSSLPLSSLNTSPEPALLVSLQSSSNSPVPTTSSLTLVFAHAVPSVWMLLLPSLLPSHCLPGDLLVFLPDSVTTQITKKVIHTYICFLKR